MEHDLLPVCGRKLHVKFPQADGRRYKIAALLLTVYQSTLDSRDDCRHGEPVWRLVRVSGLQQCLGSAANTDGTDFGTGHRQLPVVSALFSIKSSNLI